MAPPSSQGVHAPHSSAFTPSGKAGPAQYPERSQNAPEDQGSSGGSLGSDLKQIAETAADALRQQAMQFGQDIGHELNKTGEDQKMGGADAIRHVARAIHSAAAELEDQSSLVASARL